MPSGILHWIAAETYPLKLKFHFKYNQL